MEQTLAPGIVVLNKKYFPRDALSAAQVGASAFTFSVLRILLEAKILSRVVLYSRNENITTPYYQVEQDWQGVPVVTVYFHFRMTKSTVAQVLSGAFEYMSSRGRNISPPIVYYQTDTLLQYHPQGYQFCVTHHGPFVSHFTEQFSSELARLAFGGDANKVDVLEQQQRTGIRRLLQDNLGTVLAHSGLQQRVLKDEGLAAGRFKRLRPPIGVPPLQDPAILPQRIQKFVASSEILLYTAVARLDYFKNVELLVESGLELLRRGLPVKVLIVGDPEGDDGRRQALLCSVPADLRSHFLILPRLSKDHLYALFAATRHNGVFLCPSRYETLGITPLEAAAAGVTTLMTETPNVEALAFMPSLCRVAQDSRSIAARVERIHYDGVPIWAEIVESYVRPRTSLDGFREDLLRAWADMSKSGVRAGVATRRGAVSGSTRIRRPILTTMVPGNSLWGMLVHSPLSPISMGIAI
ncbi:hypothetical protein BKA67DRAFT_656729 [Truncatella angustata]|uniref:Glycosyl transferase family 1 domain-containing protein n=1 Tax=Truncatella angustata TaxID=152316 RepID=A0A9P8UUG5_9PEZI|nr:uncharacterized protein BKA67DRAFT_656729 [Truncatella angustata]KAH6658541.1 hypothetical protein BKA67DRAFT_656729 [Truncatella angustata]